MIRIKDIEKKRMKINSDINAYIINEEWDKALILIKNNEKYFENDHWLIAQKAHMLYEKRDYKEAKLMIDIAFDLKPNCPLVNDYKASILRMLEEYEPAIKIWKKFLSCDIKDFAFGECGEGMKWALSLLNDARYLLALTYFEMKDFESANHYIEEHLQNRKQGQFSNMTKKMVYDLKKRILNRG